LEQIGGELNVFEQTGNRTDATLQDLGIDADRLNKILGGDKGLFVSTDNASRVYAGLSRNFGRTSEEVAKLAGGIEKLGPPQEDAATKTKRLAGEMAILEKEVNNLSTTLLTLPSAAGVGTTQLERNADKAVAILKQRTAFETDWITTNGIVQLGLVEKNVDERLTLLGDETKEQRKIREDAQKEERKARDEGLTGTLFVPETEAKKVIKSRQKTAADSMKIAKDGSVQILQISGAVAKKQIEDINAVTTAQIAAGERRGIELEKEFEKQTDLLASAETTWVDYGNAVVDIFASVTKKNNAFSDTWIGTLTDWAIGNRRILDTVSDLWSGKAKSITGSAVSIFGTMADLLTSIHNARRDMARLDRAEDTSRRERLMDRGFTFTEAEDIIQGRRTLGGEPVDQESREEAARARTVRRRGGGRPQLARSFIAAQIGGRVTRTPIATGVTGAEPIAPPQPFVPRRQEGIDRFGRPIAPTPAMAPAAPGRAGDVKVEISVVLPNVTDIRDLDSADMEIFTRDGVLPALESLGFRVVRSDNLMVS